MMNRVLRKSAATLKPPSTFPFNRKNFSMKKTLKRSESFPKALPLAKVDVIAHRGASGNMPDHTLETYIAAFETGADWIELDAHCTLDGELVINHDIELGETTDVADWAWAAPLRTRTDAPCYDGEPQVMEGWMVSDFTLAQLKKLRVKMRHQNRSQEFNLKYSIPTVEETCNLLQGMIDSIRGQQSHVWEKDEWLEARNDYVLKHGFSRGNLNCGLYIETKRPSWYRSMGLPLEEKLVACVENSNFKGPVIIQSFEEDSLQRIEDIKSEWSTVKLMTFEDVDELMKIDGALDEYLKHLRFLGIDGIGPSKLSIIPDASNPPNRSILIDTAHHNNLFVHPYTFKSDVTHLDRVYGGNASQEFGRFFELGVDGVFADFPGHAVFARELYNRARLRGEQNFDLLSI
jgi:glycerophosphoryl diester phosphodiesterase